jgi:hypothetical protein
MSNAKVFLSYVGDTRPFVDAFSGYFFTYGGQFHALDWLDNNVPAGGKISDEIAERIASARVFVAFICKDYPQRMGADELRMAVCNREAGQNLAIVPITLGQTGRDWWTEFRQESGLGDMADQPFFRPGTDTWQLPNDARSIHAIQHLREFLSGRLSAQS